MATTATLPPYMLPGVPVHQPAHLEGDPALATEILPGPPSLLSAQQSAQKRDPKKPSTMYSYLPPSDPGSTYSGVMHGTLIGLEEPRSKRPRADKGSASGRAQRASARNQQHAVAVALDPSASNDNTSGSSHQPIILDAEPSSSGAMDDDVVLSRSNSSVNLQDPPPQPLNGKPSKRDKGKGKDVGTPPVRVKEEPKFTLLYTPEPASNLLNNNDHCSACRSTGALVYCDGCPRAFHLWCLDPPMESIDEGDSRWFCPSCVIKKHPPRKPPPSLLAPLVHQLNISIPVEFQLPDDIRNFFRDVGSGPRGTYVDMFEVKPPRLNRHGQLEDRDPHRLRDRTGAPVLCFQCGMSALPPGLASTVPAAKRPRRSTSKAVTPEGFKDILSCDFCGLHWHLDCLDPPLSAMPPFNKKWMCPNHAEQLIPSKRRTPKQNASPVEISKPRQWNNGHIDVIHPEPSTTEAPPRAKVDEVLINGRRYRVPEKIIVLDFWNKVSKHDLSDNRDMEMASGLSSPLTSLSSLDDLDEPPPASHNSPDTDELHAAQALFNLSHSKTTPAPAPAKTNASPSTNIQLKSTVISTASNSTASASSRPVRPAKKAASLKISSVINANMNGTESSTPVPSVAPEIAPAGPVPVVPRRNKRSQAATHPETSTRELRSRSRNTTQESSSSVTSAKTIRTNVAPSPSDSVSAPIHQYKFRTISVKMEEVDNALSLSNGLETASVSTNATQATPSLRKRRPRAVIREEQDATKPESKVDPKEKRGRKRKAKDDELPQVAKKPATETISVPGKKTKRGTREDKDKLKTVPTPLRTTASTGLHATPNSTPSRLPPHSPATPTLKIRLPRLNSASRIAAPALPSISAGTPTRL